MHSLQSMCNVHKDKCHVQPENEATAHWGVVIDLEFSKKLRNPPPHTHTHPHLKLPPVEGWEVEGEGGEGM